MSPPDGPGVAPRRDTAAGVRRAHRRRHSDPARRAGATVPWGGGPEEPQVHPRRRREMSEHADRRTATRGPPSQTDNGKTLHATPRRRRVAACGAESFATVNDGGAPPPVCGRQRRTRNLGAGTRLGVRGGGSENDRRPMIRPRGRARRSWELAASTLPHEDPRTAGRSAAQPRPSRVTEHPRRLPAPPPAAPALSTPRRRCTTLPSRSESCVFAFGAKDSLLFSSPHCL